MRHLRAWIGRLRARTWILAGAVVVLLAVGGTVAWFAWLQPASTASATQQTRTATASLETLEQSVAASGSLTPSVQEDVSFAASGTVTSVLVAAGETVTAGQALATIDTLQLDAARLEAVAQLASAQSQLSSASGTAAVAAATAQVAVAQAAADEATAAMADATLTAPVAGLVTSVGVAVGDAVGGGSSGASGGAGASGGDTSTAAFSIVGTDAWGVSLAVGESDVTAITAGDQVELTTDDGDTLFGVVSEIGLLPATDSGAVEYPIEVTVTGDATGLYDGMSVTAAIITERRTDVLTVPTAAVTTADGVSTVTVVDADGTQRDVEVTVGESSGDLTEIVDGIAEGDEVVMVVFTGGAGNQGETGQTGQFPGGGELPDGFDPSQLGGGQGGPQLQGGGQNG